MKMPVIIALSLTAGSFSLPSDHVFTPTDILLTQPSPSFTSFHGHRQGNGIMLMWSMSNDASVVSYRVESTYEDPSDPYSVWINRGTISNDHNRMQQFKDASVFPGTMYYKVYAQLSNGTMICSDMCTIRIVSH